MKEQTKDNNTLFVSNVRPTAVEWLYNHLFPKQLDGFSDEEWNKIDLAFKQAKEMEKQEKIDFADKYGTYLLQGGIMSAAAYNETFKSE